MPISLQSNIASARTQRQLSLADSEVGSAYVRLATGQRINRASDDAAGLAISMSLRNDVRVLTQAARNIGDATSLLNIASGGISSQRDITVRLKELAEQSANGTYSAKQRLVLDNEFQALVTEYQRILATTRFNGESLLPSEGYRTLIQAGFGLEGSLEIALGNRLNRLEIDRGEPFGSVASFGTGATPFEFMLRDMNNDGKLDAIVAESGASRVGVLLGNGNGTFRARVSYSVGATVNNLDVADINGDNVPDVVAVSASSQAAHVMLGNADGSLQASVTHVIPYNGLIGADLFDVNRDGYLDLFATSVSSGLVQVSLGNGNGTFKTGTNYLAAGARAPAFGDMNGDGQLDFIVGSQAGTLLRTFFGDGNGGFTAGPSHSTGAGPIGIILTDVNGDSKLDAVAAGFSTNAISVSLGNGNGTFKTYVSYAVANDSTEISAADVNYDGAIDLAVGDYTANYVTVWFGNGTGTFVESRTYAMGSGATQPQLVDLNGDLAPDLISSNNASASLAVRLGLIEPFDVRSKETALRALDRLTSISESLALELGAIGEGLSRLQALSEVLAASQSGYTAADARISDADIADETARLARGSILQQVGSSVLAQANQSPQIALQLLSG